MEQPPIIQTVPAPERKAGLGRIGLYVSLAALIGILGLILGKPG